MGASNHAFSSLSVYTVVLGTTLLKLSLNSLHLRPRPLNAARVVDPMTPPQDSEDESSVTELLSTVTPGSTLLVTGPFDLTGSGLCLRLLCQYGTSAESALIVTTQESAETAIDRYSSLSAADDSPSIGLIDTTSPQYVRAVYGDSPVMFIPSSSDLERLALGLSELTHLEALRATPRHLAICSLDPLLATTPTPRVKRFLERLSALRANGGIALYGVDFAAHDSSTLSDISHIADAVVWVSRTSTGALKFELESTRSFAHR
ncbi:RAD55 family ATPase [Halegenticoccus soli]